MQVLVNGMGVVHASAASQDHATTADPPGAKTIKIRRVPAFLACGGGAMGGVVNVIDRLVMEKLPEKAFSGALQGAPTRNNDGRQATARISAAFGDFLAVTNARALDTDKTPTPGHAYSDTMRAKPVARGFPPTDFASGKLPKSAVRETAESPSLS